MSLISKISKLISGSSTAISTTASASSSKIAKERLSVILASQRGSEILEGVNMTLLQQDVLEVVQRHIRAVAQNKPVQFNVKKDGEVDLFEMQVELHASRGNASAGASAGAGGNRRGSSRVSMGGSTK